MALSFGFRQIICSSKAAGRAVREGHCDVRVAAGHGWLVELGGQRRSPATLPTRSVVYMLIRDERLNLTESDRLSRIYFAYVSNPKGNPGPFGLTSTRSATTPAIGTRICSSATRRTDRLSCVACAFHFKCPALAACATCRLRTTLPSPIASSVRIWRNGRKSARRSTVSSMTFKKQPKQESAGLAERQP